MRRTYLYEAYNRNATRIARHRGEVNSSFSKGLPRQPRASRPNQSRSHAMVDACLWRSRKLESRNGCRGCCCSGLVEIPVVHDGVEQHAELTDILPAPDGVGS